MLSSFDLHLSGQQGSDKPGREIVMDMFSRPLPPVPGVTDKTPLYTQIPENDPRGESDYDVPWKSQPDEQLQQRRTRERRNTL